MYPVAFTVSKAHLLDHIRGEGTHRIPRPSRNQENTSLLSIPHDSSMEVCSTYNKLFTPQKSNMDTKSCHV